MENRLIAIEQSVANIQGTLGPLQTAIQDLQAHNADSAARDKALRDTLDMQVQALQDKFNVNDAQSLLQQNSITNIEGRLGDTEMTLGSTQPGDIDSLGTILATVQTTVGQIEQTVSGLAPGDVGRISQFLSSLGTDQQTIVTTITTVASEFQGLKQAMTATENQINQFGVNMGTLQQKLSIMEQTGSGRPEGNSWGSKPIMDHKCWDTIEKLKNDRTGFRNWYKRFRGTYRQVTKLRESAEIMDYLEQPDKMNGLIWTADKLRADFVQKGGNIDMYNRVADELDAILQAKTERGSQAGILWERAKGDGCANWCWTYSWYLQTTGQGISKRRGELMNPKQCGKIENMMVELQNWLDEEQNLMALGEEPLGVGYKISGLKMMAPDNLRIKLDDRERDYIADGKNTSQIWELLCNYTLNVGRDYAMSGQDQGKRQAAHRSDPMDVGGIGGMPPQGQGTDWTPWNGQTYDQWNLYPPPGIQTPADINALFKGGKKGKKGGFIPKGKGKGFFPNPNQQGTTQNFTKPSPGVSKSGRALPMVPTGTIFWGHCNICKTQGHSAARCPTLGKGFKGKCDACGLPGHTAGTCPIRFGGKGKGAIGNVDDNSGKGGDQLDLGGGYDAPRMEDQEQPAQEPSVEDNRIGKQNKRPRAWEQNVAQDQYWDQYQAAVDPYYGYWAGFMGSITHEDDQAIDKKRVKDTCLGSCNAVETGAEYEWVREEAVMDSGTVETICGPDHVDSEDIKETPLSKAKRGYWAANGTKIVNIGQAEPQMRTDRGEGMNMKPQVRTNVKGILVSISRAADAGNMTVFGADVKSLREAADQIERSGKVSPNFVCTKKTGKISDMVRKDGLYKYPVWIRRRVRETNGSPDGEWKTPQNGKIKWGTPNVTKVEPNAKEVEGMFDPF